MSGEDAPVNSRITISEAASYCPAADKRTPESRGGFRRSMQLVIQWGQTQETRRMKHDVHVVIERDEEGWLVGSVPSLPGCHTQARTLDELAERMREAIEAYLDASGDELAISDFIGIQRMTVDV